MPVHIELVEQWRSRLESCADRFQILVLLFIDCICALYLGRRLPDSGQLYARGSIAGKA